MSYPTSTFAYESACHNFEHQPGRYPAIPIKDQTFVASADHVDGAKYWSAEQELPPDKIAVSTSIERVLR